MLARWRTKLSNA
jgi:hypothetical protein